MARHVVVRFEDLEEPIRAILQEEVTPVVNELLRLKKEIARLHRPYPYDDETPWHTPSCTECNYDWPCETARILES